MKSGRAEICSSAFLLKFGFTKTIEKHTLRIIMNTISATEAQAKIFRLMDEVSKEHKTIKITGQKSNVVLVSEDDWNSIQETLFLLSVPKMRESIIEGINTPLEECDAELDW